MQTSANGLESFYSQLTPRIEADIPLWYGKGARLAGPPSFQPRPWSYFFRYPVQIVGAQEKAVLVKIRHIEEMSIAEAVQDEKMKGEMREEFMSLEKIRNTFSKAQDAPLFFAIRHLALYADLNSLVMEEADIHTLKSRFQAPPMWVEGSARKFFESHLNLAGRWLRVFHSEIGQMIDGDFFDEALYRRARNQLANISAISGVNMNFLQVHLEGLREKYQGQSLPYSTLHDNFSLANVFITGDKRICSFDPHNKLGPIYLDLAKLVTDMEACRTQVLTNDVNVPLSRLISFNAALLHGYFQNETVNFSALRLYRLISIIEKWEEYEQKLADLEGKNRILHFITATALRNNFLKLVRLQTQADYRDE